MLHNDIYSKMDLFLLHPTKGVQWLPNNRSCSSLSALFIGMHSCHKCCKSKACVRYWRQSSPCIVKDYKNQFKDGSGGIT